MNEFLTRSSFVLIMIAVYFIGLMLSNYIKTRYNVTLELKYILPIVSLAYFDYWVRLFSSHFYKFKLLDTVINEKNIKFFLSFTSYSKYQGNFRILSVEGFKGILPTISYENPVTKKTEKFSPPEHFSVNSDSCNGILDFSLICKFRRAPKPLLCIRHTRFFFFKVVVRFCFGNTSKKKTLFAIKKGISNE